MKNAMSTITAEAIKRSPQFEIIFNLDDLNRYGSWDFSSDYQDVCDAEGTEYSYEGEEKWRKEMYVKLLCRYGETIYILTDLTQNGEWEGLETGDDEATINDIVEMIEAGEWHEITVFDTE